MVLTRMKVGAYEAWVVVEKDKVEHYDIDVDEETNTATCWIACTAGKRFGVWVVKRHSKFNCSIKLSLDGTPTLSYLLLKHDKEPILREKALVNGTPNLYRPYLFGALNVTDDESALLGPHSYEELGTIKVDIRHVTNLRYKTLPQRSQQPEKRTRSPEIVQIHERAKKSATHHVTFGEIEALKVSRGRRPVYQKKAVVATFIFKYRSLDMLMADEIAPSDPPPVEREVPKPVSRKRKAKITEEEDEKPVMEISDGEDEIHEEYKRKEAQLEADLERVRRARLEHQKGKHAAKKIKCESKPVFLPGEVIDLTI